MDRNVGFGAALNRATATVAGDPLILLNDDVECEPDFVEAMLAGRDGAEMVAGVLLQDEHPDLIDSAGVIADARTLMAFDYLHGEPAEAAETAAPPFGPTGGAALYARAAFERSAASTSGSSSTTRTSTWPCGCAPRAPAARSPARARGRHVGSATLGQHSGEKYAHTGWSRGYMLRRYGVMRNPVERDPGARLRGRGLRRPARPRSHREGRRRPGPGLARRREARAPRASGQRPDRAHRCSAASPAARSEGSSALSPGRTAMAEPSIATRDADGSRPDPPLRPADSRATPSPARAGRSAQPAALAQQPRQAPAASRACRPRAAPEPPLGERPGQRPDLDRRDPGDRARRHELDLGGEPVAGDEPRVLGAGALEAGAPGGVADVPDDRIRRQQEAPAGDPRPDVEVDVLIEGEVGLVVAAQRVEQLAPQQAGGAADAEDLPALDPGRAARPPGAVLPRPAVAGQRLAVAVDDGLGSLGVLARPARAGGSAAARRPARGRRRAPRQSLRRQSGSSTVSSFSTITSGAAGARDAEVDRRGEAVVEGQREVRDAALAEELAGPVLGAVVDDERLHLHPLLSAQRVRGTRRRSRRQFQLGITTEMRGDSRHAQASPVCGRLERGSYPADGRAVERRRGLAATAPGRPMRQNQRRIRRWPGRSERRTKAPMRTLQSPTREPPPAFPERRRMARAPLHGAKG